jgi:transcriptional regulator with XRE-family HTH domain
VKRGIRGWNPAALRQARIAAGLTQEDLAGLIDSSLAPIGAWETGRSAPTPRNAAALARVLQLPLGKLLTIDPGDARLSDLRDWSGHTQAWVEQHLGIRALGTFERGARPLPRALRKPLAELYGVTQKQIDQAAQRSRDAWTQRHHNPSRLS